MAGRGKILLVDDESEITDLVKDFLEEMKFEVHAAEDGVKALKILAETNFDLIISDYNMPGFDGAELCLQIRSSTLNRATPICVVSGFLNNQVITRLVALNVIHHLEKPIKLSDLATKVEQLLQPKKPPVAYHPEFVKIIRSAIEDTFEYYLSEKLKFSTMSIRDSYKSHHDLSTFIPFLGDMVHGVLSMCINRSFVKTFAHKMTHTHGVVADDGLIQDICNELLNQISGRFKQALLERQIYLKTGLPEIRTLEKTVPRFVDKPMISMSYDFHGEELNFNLALGEPRQDFSLNKEPNIFLYEDKRHVS